jgi:hypothetical protein
MGTSKTIYVKRVQVFKNYIKLSDDNKGAAWLSRGCGGVQQSAV